MTSLTNGHAGTQTLHFTSSQIRPRARSVAGIATVDRPATTHGPPLTSSMITATTSTPEFAHAKDLLVNRSRRGDDSYPPRSRARPTRAEKGQGDRAKGPQEQSNSVLYQVPRAFVIEEQQALATTTEVCVVGHQCR